MNIPKQIIAFCHFKGGVGTSFIASNVALELAKSNFLTCLIDFDTKLPNCANILGMEIKKKQSMYRYFNNNDPEIKGQFFTLDKNISDRLYLISSSSEDEVEILEDINDNGSNVEELLAVAKDAFDIVIVDLPVDYQNPPVIETLEKADKVLVIGDLDINTVENSFRSLQMYKSINMSLSKFTYIPNKFFEHSDITTQIIQDTLGVRIGPSIPMDYLTVIESITKSKPLVNSKHRIAGSIREICSLITGNISFTQQSTKEEPKLTFGTAKEEVAPTKFSFISDEEGENKDGSS